MTPRRMHAPPARARGAAMVIALIFLVILTLLGVTVASNNALQERMAGNTRNRDLAFQAAEHALKDADTWLATQTAATLQAAIDDGDPGVLADGEDHPNDAAYWKNTFDWDSASNYILPTANVDGVADQPRYVVEKMPDADTDGDGTMEQYYRVTACGVGGVARSAGDEYCKESNAAVILQAMYKFE